MDNADCSNADREIWPRLTGILRDVFDNDTLTVTPESTAAQVEGWDSLNNVRVFLAIEQCFGVRFSAGEISGIKNIGALVRTIEEKTAR